jgi:hypothetical protein
MTMGKAVLVLAGLAAAALVWKEMPSARRYLKIARM